MFESSVIVAYNSLQYRGKTEAASEVAFECIQTLFNAAQRDMNAVTDN